MAALRKVPVTEADRLYIDRQGRYTIREVPPRPNPRIERLIEMYADDFHDDAFHFTDSRRLKRHIVRHHRVRKDDFDAAFVAWLLKTGAGVYSAGFAGTVGPFRPRSCSRFDDSYETLARSFRLRIERLERGE